MTSYHLKPKNSPSLFVQETKEKRRKVLEAVWERRKKNYQRLLKKRQFWETGEMV
jgi:hypothetical protein